MHKCMTQRLTAIVLFLVILISTGASGGCVKDSGSPTENIEPQKMEMETTPGYDIVLVLDESTSLSAKDISQRNEAAKMLVKLLSGDCRLAALFFAKSVAEDVYTNTFVSTSTEEGKESLLTTFDRIERIPNGTNMNVAVEAALELHDNDSPNEKVIILMTDGINHVVKTKGVKDEEKTEIVDEELRATVQRAEEMEIPIYVIYIDDGSITEDGEDEVAHICDLFSSKAYKSDELEKSVTENGNKVVHLADMGELRHTFLNLFSALKNISYKEFTASESGIVDIPVPTIGATGIQIIAESNKDFTLEGMYNINDGEQLVETASFKSGQPMVIAYPDDDSRIPEGLYQIAFSGEGKITGAISIETDFEAEITLSQSGSGKIYRAVPTDAVVSLLDKNGNKLDGGKKLSMILIIEGVEYPLEHNESSYTAEGILFDSIGEQAYTLDINYDGIHYLLNGKTQVNEKDFGNGGSYKLTVPSDYDGEAVEVCKIDECLEYADLSKAVDVEVVSGKGNESCRAYLSEENSITLSNANPRQKYRINVSFSDLCGKNQKATIVVSMSRKLSLEEIIVDILAGLLLTIMIATVVMSIVYGKQYEAAKNKIKTLKQDYKVIVETDIDDQKAIGHLVYMNSETLSEHNAVRDIGDAVFFREGKSRRLSDIVDEKTEGLKLLLSSEVQPTVYTHGKCLYRCSRDKLIECNNMVKTLIGMYFPLRMIFTSNKTREIQNPGDFFTHHSRNGEDTNCISVPLSAGAKRETKIEYNGRIYYITITKINN